MVKQYEFSTPQPSRCFNIRVCTETRTKNKFKSSQLSFGLRVGKQILKLQALIYNWHWNTQDAAVQQFQTSELKPKIPCWKGVWSRIFEQKKMQGVSSHLLLNLRSTEMMDLRLFEFETGILEQPYVSMPTRLAHCCSTGEESVLGHPHIENRSTNNL